MNSSRRKDVEMKLQQCRQVLGEIVPIMATRVQVRFEQVRRSVRQIGMDRSGFKNVEMEFKQSWQVLREIAPVMAAGIQVKLMRDVPRGQQLVQNLGALIEAIVIF